MFEYIQRAIEIYTARPLSYMKIALSHFVLQLLFLFAVFGVYTIIFVIAAFFNAGAFSIPMIIVTGLLAFSLVYITYGLKGALASAYNDLTKNEKTGFLELYKDTWVKAPKMFGLFLLEMIMTLVFVGPILAIYYFALAKSTIPYVVPIVGIIAFGIIYIIQYIFFPAFISAGIYNTGVRSSLSAAFKCIKSTHIFLFFLFGIYVVAYITQAVPILQLLSTFVTLPLVYLAMVLYFQNRMGGSSQVSTTKSNKRKKLQDYENSDVL